MTFRRRLLGRRTGRGNSKLNRLALFLSLLKGWAGALAVVGLIVAFE